MKQILSVAILIVSCLVPGSAQATAIAVIRTDREVLLAADSLGRGHQGLAALSTCKIRQVGKYAFAVAGLTEDSDVGFDAYRILARAVAAGRTVRGVADAAAPDIKAGFEASLERIQRQTPEILPVILERGLPEFVVVGWDKAGPVSARRIARLEPSGAPRYTVTFEPFDMTDGKQADAIGMRDEILGYAAATTDEEFWGIAPASRIRKLVELEIAAHPDFVGGPVDIVQIRRGGLTWLARKASCAPPTHRKSGRRPPRKRRR